jgi:hypothetical protein
MTLQIHSIATAVEIYPILTCFLTWCAHSQVPEFIQVNPFLALQSLVRCCVHGVHLVLAYDSTAKDSFVSVPETQ